MAKKVLLGMPGYGNQSAFAARAFWCASADDAYCLDRKYIQGSLLARVFNQLWCWALNETDVDYFAMLHSDIEPPDGWLDVLIGELDNRELDVLSAVVPIKVNGGLTSTALQRSDDNWNPLCRLTLNEVHELPETFTAEDTGHPLLLNTGCWVCRFDPEWAKQIHFEINDRIVYCKQTGTYVPEVEPEDWFFSRLCNELGLKIGATRKVALNHRGEILFPNSDPWGDETYDSHFISESLIPARSISFPHDVDGWLDVEEGEHLSEIARGKTVLEIGSYLGRSTICMAQTARRVDAVDPHDGRGTPCPQDTHDQFRDNLERHGAKNVRVCRGVAKDFKWQRVYDVVFIDGAHDVESVRDDIDVALSVLVDGGTIAFHDYHSGRDPGVDQAVDEFIKAGAEILSTRGTVAVILPPTKVLMEN